METFCALLTICDGNSLATGEFPAQRPVTRSFDVFFDRRLNKRLSKQSWGWWFETPSCSLWLHCNEDIRACRNRFLRNTDIALLIARPWGRNMISFVNSHHTRFYTLLKRKCVHFDEISLTGCIESCQNDNCRCSQWWKFHQKSIFVSVIPDHWPNMMTSSNGNIFRVTGPLCGEFTGHRWIPRAKASDAKLGCFLWSEASDLRRYRAHYDVIVIVWSISYNTETEMTLFWLNFHHWLH